MKIKIILVSSLFAVSCVFAQSGPSLSTDGWARIVTNDHCNSVFSPVALATCAAILGEATSGEHRAKIADALDLLTDFSEAFKPVIDFYNESSESNAVFVAMAPSLWLRPPVHSDKDYTRLLQNNFEAEVGRITSPVTVNAWTDAKTDGRIPNIIEHFSNKENAVLAMGIAFEGAWEKPFDAADTTEETFYCTDKTTVQVPMMSAVHSLRLYNTPEFSSIRLPFAAKGISMLIMRPEEKTTLAQLRGMIKNDNLIPVVLHHLRSPLSIGSEESVTKISVPIIEIRSKYDVKDTLSSFNVPTYGYAAISKQTEIDRVKLDVHFRISEKSKTLARKHSITDKTKKDSPAKPGKSFICNRPFLYFVLDEKHGTVIIAGIYTGVTGGHSANN